jgi:hypothetical protein
MMDFTYKLYQRLLTSFLNQKYRFQTLEAFIENPTKRAIVLRHDVDRLPQNALKMAEMEHGLGINATYYFRAVPDVFRPEIMEAIVHHGHELGYHYENMDNCNGDFEEAYRDFIDHLSIFRKIYPVKTICMHGSPWSKYDNRDLWKKYDYRTLGITAEPYFDVNYTIIFYLTDTGRRWNNVSSNIRDKVPSGYNIQIQNTVQLISLVDSHRSPDKMMLNIHPHRWFDFGFGWLSEIVFQNIKNVGKSLFLKVRK